MNPQLVMLDDDRKSMFKSLFILWITGPRSSVRPSLTRAWWLSATGYVAVLEPPPGRGGRQWLGSLPRHSAGVGIPKSHCQVTRSTAILAYSIPSPSSHGSAMARMGRKSLIHTQQPKSMLEVGKQRHPRIYNIHVIMRFSVRQSSRIS